MKFLEQNLVHQIKTKEMEKPEEKIKLIFINDRALTFKVEDYLKLRTEHRIIGKLMGACVPYPRNVSFNMLPAIYNQFQTRFLIEKSIVELEYKKNLTKPPTDEMKEAFKEYQMKLVNEAQEPYVEAKLEAVRSNMDSIIKGKTNKLIKSGIDEKDIHLEPEEILKQEEKRIRSTLNSTVGISKFSQVPTQHPFQLKDNLILHDFPISNMSKYKVFCDLWHKGFYITNGESFGGDFLTYHDDPMYFHASQIVHVVNASNKFELYFPISCSRLAVSVKKKCVFAYVNEHNDTITYQTMFWDNPKLIINELYGGEGRDKRKRKHNGETTQKVEVVANLNEEEDNDDSSSCSLADVDEEEENCV